MMNIMDENFLKLCLRQNVLRNEDILYAKDAKKCVFLLDYMAHNI